MLIAQLTDLHIRPKGIPAYRVAETNMLTERALRAVSALRPAPDAVVISGDLTDCGLTEEYALLAAMLACHLTMPVYVIPGNHDRRDNMVAGLPRLTLQDGFVQYAVEDLPVRLVMLDTVVPGAAHGELCAARLDFLDRTLAARPNVPTVIVMHHPPFACGMFHNDQIALHAPEAFAAIVARHKQVQRIWCGHHHRPVFTSVAQAIASIAPSVAHQLWLSFDPAMAEGFVLEPPAFQMHRWTERDGFASHTMLVETYPGPFPFIADPAYPGQAAKV